MRVTISILFILISGVCFGNKSDILINKKKGIVKAPISNEEKLLGRHVFGVQFIWDGYGSAIITKEGKTLKITGSQFSKDKTEYTKMNGQITI